MARPALLAVLLSPALMGLRIDAWVDRPHFLPRQVQAPEDPRQAGWMKRLAEPRLEPGAQVGPHPGHGAVPLRIGVAEHLRGQRRLLGLAQLLRSAELAPVVQSRDTPRMVADTASRRAWRSSTDNADAPSAQQRAPATPVGRRAWQPRPGLVPSKALAIPSSRSAARRPGACRAHRRSVSGGRESRLGHAVPSVPPRSAVIHATSESTLRLHEKVGPSAQRYNYLRGGATRAC